MYIGEYKNHIGKILFALSVLVLGVMLFTPLNNVFIHADEYFTLFVVKFSVSDIISINVHDVHPPLYYLIVKAVMKVLAILNISYNPLLLIKILSIIPYGAILLFSAIKIRQEYGWLTAGIFTFALGCMSQFFMHFILGRMYSLGILFMLIAFYYCGKVLKDGDKKSWILLTVFSVLGAYTHYFVAISALALYLMLLIHIAITRQSFKKWAISASAGIILYLPWVYALVNQLAKVHNSYWIKELTLDYFIKCLGYFATNSDIVIIEIIAVAALIFFTAILVRYFRDFSDSENYFILSGICVFLATLVIGSILSVVFKPILVARYLIPASAVLWFAVSVMIGKIKDNRILFISLALVMLLSVCAISDSVSYNDKLLHDGNANEKLLDKINDGDIVIFNSGVGLLEFGEFLGDCDIYTIELDNPLGIKNKDIHARYDFKELNETGIENLVLDNPDKKIYLVDAWGDLKFDNLNRTDAGKISNVKFYEV